MAQQIVAIDVHRGGARLARIEASLRRAQLGQVGWVPFTPGQDVRGRIDAIAQAVGGNAESIIVAIDAGRASTRLLNFPFTDPRKLSAAVEFELEGQIPYPLDQVALAWATTGTPGAGADVLTAIVPRDELVEQLHGFVAAGLEPRAMVLPAVGLGQYLALRPATTQGILYVGWQQSHLAVGAGKLAYARTLRFGEDDMGEATPAQLEPLVVGLQTTFLALPASHSPGRLLLCGSAPGLPAMAEHLTARLGLPVELLDVAAAAHALMPAGPGDRATAGRSKAAAPPPTASSADAIALGLALAVFRHGHDVPLNLRRGALAYRGDLQILRDQLPRLAMGLAAVLLAAIFAAAVRFSMLRDQEKQLDSGFCSATQRIVGRQICDPTAALATLRATPGAQSTPIPSYSASSLLEMVSKSIPAGLDVHFDDLELRVDNGSSSMPERLTGKGEAATFDAAEQLVAALKRDACVQEAELGKQQRTQGGRVSFVVTIKVACPTGVQPGTKLVALSTPPPPAPPTDATSHAGPPP